MCRQHVLDFAELDAVPADLYLVVHASQEFELAAAAKARAEPGTLEQKIVAPTSQTDGLFGWSVAVSEDRVLVAAIGTDFGGVSQAGAAYLFQLDGGLWQLEETFGSPMPSQEFGFSVDLSSATGTVVVGEPLGATPGFSPTGAVSCYELSGNVWSFTQRLLPDISHFDGRFGESISLSGDDILIGAYRDDEGGVNRGAAYVYNRTGGVWSLEQKLIDGPGDQVGRRVSLSGDTAILSTRNSSSPRAVIYEREQGEWLQDTVLINEQSGSFFGREVTIDGDRAIVGSREISSGPGPLSARIYSRDGGEWTFFGFRSHPQDAQACLGDPALFSVEAEGVSPLTYQWQRNGVDLPGEVSADLVIDSLTPADIATYTVVITSPCGTLTSNSAEVECTQWMRGDCDGDGTFHGLLDALQALGLQFTPGGSPPPCLAQCDADSNGVFNGLLDGLTMLNFQFVAGSPPIGPPFGSCGGDVTVDSNISCSTPTCQ